MVISRGTGSSNPSPSSSESCANCVSASNFTRDGYREDRFAADHLKKIKEVENNGAVVGQSAMWRYYLTNRTSGDMLAREYPFLKFGAAAEYAVEQGVPDKLWRSHEPRQRSTLFDEDPSD